jgi:hypothetical protein
MQIKNLIFVLLALVIVLVLLVGVVALIGSQLPKTHVVSRSIVLHRSAAEVYKVVRRFEDAPKWRGDVKHVEVDVRAGGPVFFREDGANGVVNYELVKDVPGELMVTRIRDTDLGYSGQWTYTFAPESGGTRVTIREEGEVSNVIFRFLSRYVFGHTATMDSYLKSLAAHFGEDVSIQDV